MRYLSIEYNVNFASKGNVVIYIVSLPFFYIIILFHCILEIQLHLHVFQVGGTLFNVLLSRSNFTPMISISTSGTQSKDIVLPIYFRKRCQENSNGSTPARKVVRTC